MNKVRVAPTVITALSELKDDDAENLGKGMLTIILSNTEASAAVDHWIAQNPALEEFEKEQTWMRPFFVEIAVQPQHEQLRAKVTSFRRGAALDDRSYN